jgi:alpha-glucosidase
MFGKIMSWQQMDQTVTFQFQQAEVRLHFLHDSLFRVFVPLKRDVFFSRAIDRLPEPNVQLLNVQQLHSHIEMKTADLLIHVKDDLKIDIFNHEGELLCSDFNEQRTPFARRGNSELAKEEGHDVIEDARQYKSTIIKKMNGDEAFYGLGERPGHLNKRGCFYRNWNTDDPSPHVESYETLYKSIPFFITLTGKKAFGIFFDNTYETFFDFGKENDSYYYFAANDGNLDYYFMYGPQVADVIGHYTSLTGTTPLPQKWTLGYQQCRWSYPSAERVKEIATQFRSRNIPCDVIYLDIDYMDGYRVFTWNRETFPDPQGLIAELAAQGFKVVTIIDPGVKKDRGYDVYEQGLANGYYATDADGVTYVNRVWPGDSVYPDFTSGAVRSWWGDQHKSLLELGVAGIWTDMNEPASFNGPLPDDVQFKNDGYPTDHREAHNVYGSMMARATYDGVKKWTGKRPFVITRACYAGTQKYSTIWTGDNQSFWEHLRMSIPMLSNLGVSGMAFVGTDVGGFGYDCTGELLSRWVQIGCFTPLFRNHSAALTRDQEPWTFDERTEQINRKYIQLRYRLLPYLYDQLWRSEKSGLPLIRPLVLHYQEDHQTHNLNDQFLCGDAFMVAPIVQQGQTVRQVYLPQGTWVDYWSKQVYQGGAYILQHAELDECPVFVKAGSLLPNNPPQQFVGDGDGQHLIIEYFPDHSSATSYYEHLQDDGETFGYQVGQYHLWQFSATWHDSEIRLSFNKQTADATWAETTSIGYKKIEWRIYDSSTTRVTVNGNVADCQKTSDAVIVLIDVT